MSAVTAWTGSRPLRGTDTLGVVAASRFGRRNAREAYRAMLDYGIPSWEARGYVIRLLGAQSDVVRKVAAS